MRQVVRGVVSLGILCGLLQTVQAQDTVRVDINVSTKRTTYNVGASNRGESKVKGTALNVTLKKSSSMPYAGVLTAELYVLGKKIHKDGVYGVIDVLKPDFTFSTENGNEFKFTAGPYHLGKTSGNINVGAEYETYLVVITDASGKIVATKSGRKIKEQGIEKIRQFGPLTLFDKEGNVVGKADPDQKAFKRATPAAILHGDRD